MKSTSLQEITDQEAGIILFNESHKIIICNWSSINGIPRMFLWKPLGGGEEIECDEPYYVDDINKVLGDVYDDDVIYDINDDIYDILSTATPALVYHCDEYDITIIAPKGWN